MLREDQSGKAGEAEIRSEDVIVDAPGGRVFARIWGDLNSVDARAPVILLHDSLGSVELWRDFPGRLASALNRCVIAYDRLGFGKSDPYPGKLPLDFIRRQARSEFAALRARLGIKRMILFGQSVGGGMAVAVGAAFPDMTEAVITEAAQCFVDDGIVAGVREAEAAFAAPGQLERLARYHGDKARWALDAWTKTWTSPEFAAWSLDEELRALRCPVLAIHGDRDEYGSTKHADRIAGLAPRGSQAVILEDSGHVPHREIPESVLSVVSAFVKSLPSG
jgi:pimeloyl-ACP methyl ester carboxylesterase